uniref:DIOX_N domain-containing protein n=1 Tax=Heterorhabditis bacteriophora TaxID=37862 RepID=A0A1I7W8X5_HETBA
MCVEGEGFMNCIRWPEIPLEEIINRHEFLLKCGRYITPDPKHPQSKMENPELRRILDSSGYHFAVQVAGVSEEEWIIYRTLSIKMMEQSTSVVDGIEGLGDVIGLTVSYSLFLNA